MDVVQNSQKLFVRVWMLYRTHRSSGYGLYPGKHTLGEGVRLEVEDLIQLAWHVLAGPTPPTQSVALWALSATATKAINREPQRVATGATAALTATDHSTAYPAGGASKKIMAVASKA